MGVHVHPHLSCPLQFQEEELDGEEAPHKQFRSTSLKFNNNILSSWEGFSSAVRALLLDPLQLGWVDLSFNDLHNISAVSRFMGLF